jgi:hypothetical protein
MPQMPTRRPKFLRRHWRASAHSGGFFSTRQKESQAGDQTAHRCRRCRILSRHWSGLANAHQLPPSSSDRRDLEKIILALAPTLALVEPAAAQSTTRSFYDGRGSFAGSSVTRGPPPPPQFDYFYKGSIKVKRDSSWVAPCRPKSLSSRLGCAYPPEESGGECLVFLAWRQDIEEAGFTENMVWRQLMARCNGWKDYRSGSKLGDRGFSANC